MYATRQPNETPRERLLRMERTSRPFRRELSGPTYLIAVTLLLLAILLIVIGILGGTLGLEVLRDYTQQIFEWALPAGRSA